MPPDAASRDAALVMDIVLAARDALDFVVDLDEAAFLASRSPQPQLFGFPGSPRGV